MTAPVITGWLNVDIKALVDPWSAASACAALAQRLGQPGKGARVRIHIGPLRIPDPALVTTLMQCGAASWDELEILGYRHDAAEAIADAVRTAVQRAA